MQFIPSWTRAAELADLGVQSSPGLAIASKRAVVAMIEPHSRLVLLKILIGQHIIRDAAYRQTVEQSLLRGGQIRSQHPAFSQLIEFRWTAFGLVTINEYFAESFPLAQLRCLDPKRLVNLSIRMCDAISHIHFHASSHGDISSENVIVNDREVMHIVDYDLADPVPGLLRTSYDTQPRNWSTLAARQSADIRALGGLVTNLLIAHSHRDCDPDDETRSDVARLIRRLRQLAEEDSPSSWLQALQATLRTF